jgi:hypothetical protein
MIEYEKNVIMCPDNEHYTYEDAIEEIGNACEKLNLSFAGIPLSGNDFGFGHAEKILFSKQDGCEWTMEEMEELDEEINERLH